MSALFEDLREQLLRGGIAPRHVKRYLRELSEHLADTTEAQRAAGLSEADAALMARTQLGEDDALAQAMIQQRDFRSVSARFPWLVFLLAPPFALVLGYSGWVLIVLLIGEAGGLIVVRGQPEPLVPSWFQAIATASTFAANMMIGPATAWGVAWVAQRQRLSLAWPFIAIAVMIVLGFQGFTEVDGTYWTIQLHTAFPVRLGASGPLAMHWPTLFIQTVLLSLPLFWLLRMRRKNGAAT